MLIQAIVGSFAGWRSRTQQATARESQARLTERLDTARQAEAAFKVQMQEWKNILSRGHDPALRARHGGAFRAEQGRVAVA